MASRKRSMPINSNFPLDPHEDQFLVTMEISAAMAAMSRLLSKGSAPSDSIVDENDSEFDVAFSHLKKALEILRKYDEEAGEHSIRPDRMTSLRLAMSKAGDAARILIRPTYKPMQQIFAETDALQVDLLLQDACKLVERAGGEG